ncbi:DUF397 domain-containing protein [Streptomyces sp. NBC_01136]|uniref:DUF397 domain-containing protein n=1 Tax=unclassified Streptomyces TaxID=2593676 RepID=UPI00324E5E98|nr:DUF397 domain-containing protein [Streptomyces sp. NBC_01136]
MARTSRLELNGVVWRKSSYSNQEGGNCVEVADEIPWRKSSYSNQEGGDCLEVADGIPGIVPVRDSKAPDGPALAFAADSWAAFIGDLKARHRI